MALLEGHYRDLCDIEFTIERGTLWMLQTRVGKRTAGAAFRIAAQLVDEGVIDADEALRRVSGTQLVQLMFPQFDTAAGPTGELVLGRGHARLAGCGGRQGGVRLLHRGEVEPVGGEGRSWCAGRPTRTT